MPSRPSNMMTSEEIYEDMCRKIEKLAYMPGEKLSENELCSVYGVTRHVIRNALTGLKNRRLVEVYPQRGTYVSLIDMEYIEDILYMRESVEQEALARIMDMEDRTAVVREMEKAAAEQAELLDSGEEVDSDRFYELDNNFHQTIFQAIGRPNIMSLLSESYIHIRRWRNFEIRTKQRMREIGVEHTDIIEAVRTGERERARECMHRHLDTVTRYSRELMEKEPEYFL